ncbi:MAG: response regulator, partial [Acidobacteriota bacterium]
SEADGGSEFHFTAAFPLADIAATETRPEPLLANVPILIVDDNPVNRRIFQTQLARWGARPSAVVGGREAIAVLTHAARSGQAFELILLDVNMPEMDGFDVAQLVAGTPELAGTVILMLSSSAYHDERARSQSLGIAAYLTKPVQADDLHDAVCRVLRRGEPAPTAAPARAKDTKEKRPASPGLVRPLRILLVEDNVVNQRVATGLLGKRGHQMTVANDGLEALNALAAGTFDLVLMDMQMPVMGGAEATAAIRRREETKGGHIRIVAMTAHAMDGDRERCLAAGMDGYLSKPIDPTLLFATVENEFQPSAEPLPAPPATPPAAAAPASVAALDVEGLRHRLGGDEKLLADVLLVFREDCPARLAAIKAAVEARDAKRISSSAHALKGAAGNLSATGLFEAARTLEQIGTDGQLDHAGPAWEHLLAQATRVMTAIGNLVPGSVGASA